MTVYLIDSQKEILNKLVAFQEDPGKFYPFYYSISPNGRATILGLLRFEFDPNDFQTLVDTGLLHQISEDHFRITRKGYEAASIRLTDSAKEALHKLIQFKEQGGLYPFSFERNTKGNWVELFLRTIEIEFVDFERLIDFRLLHRNQGGCRITQEGYEAVKSNFESLKPVVDDTESLRRQLNQHQSTLNKLQEESAVFTVGHRPPHLLNQIEHEEAIIVELKTKLGYEL